MDNQNSVIYRINSRDEIIFVNDIWDKFAVVNKSFSVIGSKILGRPIWEFMSDLTTHDIYLELVKKARSGEPVQFKFRCDSPDIRRLLEMQITLVENEQIQFESRTIMAEMRSIQRFFSIDTPRSEQLISVCSWCNRLNSGKEFWREVEDAINILGIFEKDKLPNISYSTCGECCGPLIKQINVKKNKTIGK
jgi:hypothetical protein